MNNRKGNKQANLEKEIDRVIDKLSLLEPQSLEYKNITENLDRLYKAKGNINDRKISPDTIAVIAGNLIGIALIIWHEEANSITSKALGFVIKGRV